MTDLQSRITEVAADVYRISTFHPQYGIQFNQYLVKDDEPFLMHTLMRSMFPVTRAAVASIVDPAAVRWIGFSHFEADECGALNEWLAIAPRAEAVCSFIGATVTLADCADRPARALADDEVLETGRHRLQFLATPHVPHCWDAGPFARDMPYTPYTDATFRRLAALKPRTLGLMHGATFRGDGERALLDLAGVIRETLGK